jgi:hypothetical protein
MDDGWSAVLRRRWSWPGARRPPGPPSAARGSPAPTCRSTRWASANVTHVTNIPHSGPLTDQFGTDLAFKDGKAFVGNYNGFVVYDVTNPTNPTMLSQVSCPGSQNDISVHGNLLFLSTDSSRSDDSCSSAAQSATVKSSWEGIKIFDISDVRNPR